MVKPEDFGVKNKDWIQYDMHMCFNELLYASNNGEREDFYTPDGYYDTLVNTMGWLKFKLPVIKTVVAEINFFTVTNFAGHLISLSEEYSNVENVVIVLPEKRWMSAKYAPYSRVGKTLRAIKENKFDFKIHNIELLVELEKESAENVLSGTDALRLLDHSMNFYWREENMHEDDYFSPDSPAWGFWYKQIINACPCITEEYLKERISNNIKLKKILL